MFVRVAIAVFILLVAPFAAHAQMEITEIMYDLEGSDADREWIEVRNTSGSSVDLSEWTFFENDTNHSLTVVQGGSTLAPGSYAIIADNAATFKNDWGNYSGVLFDSAFSLNNTGELISLRDAAGADVSSVTYSSDWGAKGDGNSLNRTGSTMWKPKAPTPGKGQEEAITARTTESKATTTTAKSSRANARKRSGGNGHSESAARRYLTSLDAGSDRVMFVGAGEYFYGEARDQFGGALAAITYQWNFGNGAVARGKRVLHQYDYPGNYVVTVTARASQEREARDEFVVEVKPLELVVSSVTPQYIQIENKTKSDINLSLWALRSGSQRFDFPEDTVILAGATLTFPNSVTDLTTLGRDVALHYPSKATAHHISWKTPPVGAANRSLQASAPQLASVPEAVPPLPVPEAQTSRAALPALAAESFEPAEGNIYPWLTALLILLVLSVGGLLFIRHRVETVSEADTYAIIDKSKDA